MKLIVGLGNPGRAYAGSRHNIGFLVVEALAKEYGVKLKKTFGRPWICAKAEIEGSSVLLAEPLTYMNLSGSAVAALLKKNKIGINNLLVVCDDLDLDLGRLKIRDNGSSGGHRGLESIIRSLASREFSRLRAGIGRPGDNMDASDYVLSQFKKDEKKQVLEIVEKACACVRSWIAEGVDKTMNTFNKKE
ncbi:MAG: aminoacyl-tRNA hydrolase [Candidatus Omnitrophota bacterium]